MQASARASDRRDYRPDIDGLRGIAVLSVILYHIDGRWLPGGFVGVDIFFVISGFLISLHIFSEIEAGKFSLAEFYRRRIKRIAPAMLLVVGVTLALTQMLFVPDDAEVAAEAAFFSLASLANVYFWKFLDTSYFAASTDQQPFLHLWSLGVEEQFYILWPLLLMAFYRGQRSTGFVAACVVVAAVSFALGDLLFEWDPSFVYYMLPTRAGELLIGALAAQWILRRPTDERIQSAVPWLAIVGLFLVVGSFAWTSEARPFPGWRAIPPTVGTAMLILAGHYGSNRVTSGLRWSPLVWVGGISYSAYLWHWPILSIPRYFGVEFGFVLGSAAFVATLALAWLSFRYVEQPARASRRPFVSVAWRQYVLPAGVLAAVAVGVKLTDGYGARVFIPQLQQRLAAVERETQPAFEYDYICQQYEVRSTDLANPKCIVGAPTTSEPKVMLWGDSNGSHYVGMLGAFAQREGYAFRNVAAAGCPPVTHDLERIVNASRLASCRRSSELVATHLADRATVWIAADWLTYNRKSQHFLPAFEATVRELAGRGKRVVIIGKAPLIAGYDRRCRQKAVMMPALDCDYSDVPLPEEVGKINAEMRNLVSRIPGVAYFDANSYLCAQGRCRLRDESGKLIYFDSSHISLDASWRLGEEILRDGVPDAFRLSGGP